MAGLQEVLTLYQRIDFIVRGAKGQFSGSLLIKVCGRVGLIELCGDSRAISLFEGNLEGDKSVG